MSADTNPQSKEFNLGNYFKVEVLGAESIYPRVVNSALSDPMISEALKRWSLKDPASETRTKRDKSIIQLGKSTFQSGLFSSIIARVAILTIPFVNTTSFAGYTLHLNANYLHPMEHGAWTQEEISKLHDHLSRIYGSEKIEHHGLDNEDMYTIDDPEEETRTLLSIGGETLKRQPWIYLRTEHITADLSNPSFQRIPIKDQADIVSKYKKFGNLAEVAINGIAKIKGVPQGGVLKLDASPTNKNQES